MLYKLDTITRDYSKVERVSFNSFMWKESDLQALLSNHIKDLISNSELMTIFNERPRQEEPDILALDKKGDLYIFELKSWASHQENLLQVLRYGQLFGNSDYNELNELFRKYVKNTTEELNLANFHMRYFDLDESSKLNKDDFNKTQHFLIVTNGLDQKTIESIIYWKKNGLKIDAIVYWIFKIDNSFFIEFNMYSPIENFLEFESNTYILNTNYSNNKLHTTDMLLEQKASAFYPGWREKIEKFQKGDVVFLYKSSFGIIAYGYSTGKLEKKDCDQNENYEYYTKLDKFVELKTPFSASEMKRVTNQGFNFRQTVCSISEECRNILIKEIKKNYI